MKTKIIFTFIFCILLLRANAFTQWVQVSSGTSNSFTSAGLYGSSVSYAVGVSSMVRKSTDGGLSWQSLPSPSGGNFNDVSFFPAGSINTGWVCGIGLYKTTDGGLNWITQIATGAFQDIYFLNAATGWAVTLNDIRYTIDSGNTFTTFTLPMGGISLTKFAPGSISTWYMLATKPALDSTYIFKTINSGVNWSLNATFKGLNNDFKMLNTNTGYLCGDGGRLRRTTNGGSSWDSIPLPTSNLLSGVCIVSSLTAYVCGSAGYVIKTTDGGNNWLQMNVPVSSNLRTVTFADSVLGLIVGLNGVILRTTNGGITPVIQESNSIPKSFVLFQNYPNPFNPTTNIEFRIAEAGLVQLKIYDVQGKEVAVIVNQQMQPGVHSVEFDAGSVPSGIYFYRLNAGYFSETKKMILVK